jgi:hypothetical protein
VLWVPPGDSGQRRTGLSALGSRLGGCRRRRRRQVRAGIGLFCASRSSQQTVVCGSAISWSGRGFERLHELILVYVETRRPALGRRSHNSCVAGFDGRHRGAARTNRRTRHPECGRACQKPKPSAAAARNEPVEDLSGLSAADCEKFHAIETHRQGQRVQEAYALLIELADRYVDNLTVQKKACDLSMAFRVQPQFIMRYCARMSELHKAATPLH